MSNEYAKFLRDFADANIDSFEDEQLHMLRNAAIEIENLIEERNSARRDFCNASYDDPHLVAREREWDCFKMIEANANNQEFRTTDMG